MKLPEKSDTSRMTGGTDSIMSMVRTTPFIQPAPLRRSINVKIPRTNAFEPYPTPSPFHPTICHHLNVLRPEPPERRTVSLETEEKNTYNTFNKTEKERQLRERFHNAYSRYYYGNSTDKEIYRKYIRESLKQQMTERDCKRNSFNQERLKESTQAVLRDSFDIEKDKEANKKRIEFLRQFRDGNKMLMEESSRRRMEELRQEQYAERKMLQLNPINWSATLK